MDRRLSYFKIYYIDETMTVENTKRAVEQELDGPGILLGYRAMHQKVRQIYDLKVPRDLVYNVLFDLAPEELENRRPGNKKKKKKINFTTRGPNWVFFVRWSRQTNGVPEFYISSGYLWMY